MPSVEGDDNDVPPIGSGVLGHSNFGSYLSYSSR